MPVRPNADAVVASAEAGVKAIFCEKPFTNSLADADRMVEACSSRGVHIASGVMVSSHPDYQKAYALAASGEIGEVRRINLYENNAQGGCHGVNLARKFAAKSPVTPSSRKMIRWPPDSLPLAPPTRVTAGIPRRPTWPRRRP